MKASAPANPEQIIGEVTAKYRSLVDQLQQVLHDDSDRERTRRILSEMLGQVTIGRDLETGETFAELDEPAERLLAAAVGESMKVVAGAGFEPTTFGL